MLDDATIYGDAVKAHRAMSAGANRANSVTNVTVKILKDFEDKVDKDMPELSKRDLVLTLATSGGSRLQLCRLATVAFCHKYGRDPLHSSANIIDPTNLTNG
jgi:hypothetical protein